jgi:hypothetical protein
MPKAEQCNVSPLNDAKVQQAVATHLLNTRSIEELENLFARDVVEKIKGLVLNDVRVSERQADGSMRTGANSFLVTCQSEHAFKQDTYIETFRHRMDPYRLRVAIVNELRPYGLSITTPRVNIARGPQTYPPYEDAHDGYYCSTCLLDMLTCCIYTKITSYKLEKKNKAEKKKYEDKLLNSTGDTYDVCLELVVLPSSPLNTIDKYGTSSGGQHDVLNNNGSVTVTKLKDSFTSRSSIFGYE